MKLPRFSLRTLFFAVTVLGIWLGLQVHAARRQKEAVDAILKAHGSVVYDYQQTTLPDFEPPYNHASDPTAPIPGPQWLRKIAGDDFFRTVVLVNFGPGNVVSETDISQLAKLPAVWCIDFGELGIRIGDHGQYRPIGDEDLKVLENLPKLQFLRFYGQTALHGDGIKYLVGLRELKYLFLGDSPLEDSAMENIGRLTRLDELELSHTRLTSSGFKHLQSLVNLSGLCLEGSEFSDADIKYISSLPLTALNLSDTKISDSGLQQICKLSTIQWLTLDKTNITDAGLQHIQNLKLLQLSLGYTAISDASIKDLSELKDLQRLEVEGSKITVAGGHELEKSLPSLKYEVWVGSP